MKKLFLFFALFFLLSCTTTEYITREYPPDEVYLKTEIYTNPTPTPYANIYINIDSFDWHWGSYYYYPTYYYSWYYYPSVWYPYWYRWYPVEPYYYNYNGHGYTYYQNDTYYGHRHGTSTDIPSKKSVIPPKEQRREPVLTTPIYAKPTVTAPTTRYGESRKTVVKSYTPPATQPRGRTTYVSPSTKTYRETRSPAPVIQHHIQPSSRGGR